jgi:hypothetical protein
MNGKIEICPYLGMADDPATNTSYPSNWNHCHHAKPVDVVEFNHQASFCLSENHLKCPVFLRKEVTSLPNQLRASYNTKRRKNSPYLFFIPIAIFFIAILAVWSFGFFTNGQKPAIVNITKTNILSSQPPTETPKSGMVYTQEPTLLSTFIRTSISSTLTQSAFLALKGTQSASMALKISPTPLRTPTFTKTSSPTSTVSPTRTNTPKPTPTRTLTPTVIVILSQRTLDTPIGGEMKFIIHQIKNGESLSQYANIYKTSVEAIKRVNYSLMVPLWIGSFVVIPYNFIDVATDMPYFQPYRVAVNEITVEALAQEMGTLLRDFILYNGFKSGERLKLGDWVLIPWLQSANS